MTVLQYDWEKEAYTIAWCLRQEKTSIYHIPSKIFNQ